VKVGQGIVNKYFRETINGNNQKLVEWKSGKHEKQEGFKAPFRGPPFKPPPLVVVVDWL
jgi:hypothetical protein